MNRGERVPIHNHSGFNEGGLIDSPSIVAAAGGVSALSPGSGSTSTIFDSLGWFNVKDYGAIGDGTTDDTTAVQNTINACTNAGGGTVYFPPGIYQISGALQDTSTFNSQLEIPTAATYTAIRFLGSGPNKIYGGTPSTGNEAVIRSDWNGTISGNPAIVSAGTFRSIDESLVDVMFEDLTIIAPDDPKLSALQMTAAVNVRLERVQIRTTTADLSAGSLPTNSNAVGYDGPWGLGAQAAEDLWNVAITGFYTGMRPSEQSHGGTIAFAFCTRAMEFIGGPNTPTYTHWPNYFTHVTIVYCPRGLVFTSDVRWVSIGMLGFEHDLGTFAAVYDIDDASNYAYGDIAYHVVDYVNGVGSAYPLLINGGSNLSLSVPSLKYRKLNGVTEIPTGTDPSSNPATGGMLYAASATGHPTWRDSSGTVTDLLASSSSSAGQHILLADGHATPFAFTDLLQMDDGSDFMWSDP